MTAKVNQIWVFSCHECSVFTACASESEATALAEAHDIDKHIPHEECEHCGEAIIKDIRFDGRYRHIYPVVLDAPDQCRAIQTATPKMTSEWKIVSNHWLKKNWPHEITKKKPE